MKNNNDESQWIALTALAERNYTKHCGYLDFTMIIVIAWRRDEHENEIKSIIIE
jgi:hypothetical protein